MTARHVWHTLNRSYRDVRVTALHVWHTLIRPVERERRTRQTQRRWRRACLSESSALPDSCCGCRSYPQRADRPPSVVTVVCTLAWKFPRALTHETQGAISVSGQSDDVNIVFTSLQVAVYPSGTTSFPASLSLSLSLSLSPLGPGVSVL